MKIPNAFYYYWTLEDFAFAYILSIKSVLSIERPDNIVVYYNYPIPSTGNALCCWNYLKTLPIEFREFDINDFRFDFLSDEFYSAFFKKVNKSTLCEGTRPNIYRPYNVSDLARYMILYKHGGIYYDFDTLTIKSIKPLIEDCDAFIPTCISKLCKVDNQESYLANGNLGSIPNGKFFHQILNECSLFLL